jgi:hypothetical protein
MLGVEMVSMAGQVQTNTAVVATFMGIKMETHRGVAVNTRTEAGVEEDREEAMTVADHISALHILRHRQMVLFLTSS